MRVDIGKLNIRNSQSIIEARNRLYSIVLKVCKDSIISSRAASVVSQACKALLHKVTEFHIFLTADIDKNKPFSLNIALICSEPIEGNYFDNTVFDNVLPQKIIDDSYYKEVILHFTNVIENNNDIIRELRRILEEKSRDELIEEVRSTNIELKNSLDNLRKTRTAKERMESELNIGKEIQMSMLPLTFPAFPDRNEFDIYATLIAAREVGGDFYDFFFVAEDQICFCIGDVSGKGVPSALFMAVTKTLIKSRAADDISTASIITHANDELSHDNSSNMFVTIFLGILNIRTGELRYTNAGHNPSLVKRNNGKIDRLDKLHGPIVGAVSGMTYDEDSIILDQEESILLYTDGITEAQDKENKLYGEGRLTELFARSKVKGVDKIVNEIADDVRNYEHDTEQSDDITIMSILYFGKMKNVYRSEIQVSNDLNEIDTIQKAFRKFLENHQVNSKNVSKIAIAIDELLSNVINYAFTDDSKHLIDVKMELNKGNFILEIIDDGIPFNPLQMKTPDTSLNLEDRKIGGLGIHMVSKMMDKIEYKRHINKNNVKITIGVESNA